MFILCPQIAFISCIFSQAAEHLQSFIADCDRRTELAKKRLAETQDEISAEVAAKVINSLLPLLVGSLSDLYECFVMG